MKTFYPLFWRLRAAILLAALMWVCGGLMAQVSLTFAAAYTQNFDELAATGSTGSVLPTGWGFLETGSNANTTYGINNGSSSTGNTYSYGATDATDRAFGGLRSGSLTPVLGASFTNNTSAPITALLVAYTGELWRLGATGRADRIDFQYSLNATSLSSGAWIDVNDLDFLTPDATGSAGARDGNLATNRTSLSFSITGLNIAPGETVWIRWVDFDPSGSDDGLAIDDFSLIPTLQAPPPPPPTVSMRITEYMYSGTNGEFVEFTNTGSIPLDLTGWSFDDDSNTPGSFSLTGFGTVEPGESVILTDAEATAFRTAWNLCPEIKIIGSLDQGLGRNDVINLYDNLGNLVDRLAYGDQNFPGSIRTQNAAGWVSAAGLGVNDALAWTLATLADAENSYASAGGDLGSPGRSSRATVAFDPCAVTPTQIRITEYMYSGNDGEFIEFTNVSNVAIDFSGWSYDDDSRIPGTFDLSDLGVVQPGESVIITEVDAAGFRAAWNLCDAVKVLGGYSNNLGRNDEINLYDNLDNLVDRLTFGDQNFPGSIRTQNASGWVSAAGLGANDPLAWTLATLADAENSYASTSGDLGSPGRSSRATVAFDPCAAFNNLMRITEYMYSGTNGEFVEFTNIGSTTIDLTGWSFDDDSRTPGVLDLSAFGMVQPGESVVIAEDEAEMFRSAWGLCAGVKIIGGYTNNLGRADEINLFDSEGNLIDRLTYGDEVFPGSIRTQNAAGWVSAAGLGANDALAWPLASLADAENSVASSGGDLGSPGRSSRATVAYEPCDGNPPSGPSISLNVALTNDFLDAELTTAPTANYAVSGVLADPTDPMQVYGLVFEVTDAVGLVQVTVASSNETVAPLANLVLTGGPSQYTLQVTPATVGLSTLTITATDEEGSSTFQVFYAASAASTTPASTRWHTQAADASAAVAIDADYMVLADDEDQRLRVYDRNESGLPLRGFDFSAELGVSPSDEVDLEGAFRLGNRIFWLTSHGNGAEGQDRPQRRRLFATDLASTGATTTLAFVGRYDNLRADLLTWGDANGFAFSATANGTPPTTSASFNIEGFTLAPDGATAFVGFRAPKTPASTRNLALIAPVLNFTTWFNIGAPTGAPTFGDPIQLDLGGRVIRSLECNAQGCLIVAGNVDETGNFKLYTWSGNPADAPQPRAADLTDLTPEALVALPAGNFMGAAGDNLQVQLISDNGTVDLYGTGQEAKDLAQNNHKKFRSDWVSLGETQLPAPEIVAAASNLSVTCDGQGNTTALTNWLNNQAGASATAACGPGAWSYALSLSESGCGATFCDTYIFTFTDACGRTTNTEATFCVTDQTPPVVVAYSNPTVALTGDNYALSAAELINLDLSSDGCGGSLSFGPISPATVGCAQIGQTIPVSFQVFDACLNATTVNTAVTVVADDLLPDNWESANVGATANGDSYYDFCSAEAGFVLNTFGYNINRTDVAHLVYQTICGDVTLTAQVAQIDQTGGWAGLVMRESIADGARKFAVKSRLTTFARRDVRSATNGLVQTSFLNSAINHGWIRLVRTGHTFSGYTSPDGQQWFFAGSAFIPMPSCIEVGLFVESINNVVLTQATFTNVSIEQNQSLGLPDNLTPALAHHHGATDATGQLLAWPNPSTGPVSLEWPGQEAHTDAVISLFDVTGRRIWQHPAQATAAGHWDVDLSDQAPGLYFLEVNLPGHEPRTVRVLRAGAARP